MWKYLIAAALAIPAAAQDGPPAKPDVKPEVKPAPRPADKPVVKPVNSFEQQRLSVERQMQTIQTHFPAPFGGSQATLTTVNCPPVTAADVKPIIDRAASKHKVDAKLVHAIVEAESAYSPCAVSPVGALGLMQLMPATAESLQVSDPFDPNQNIVAGTQFLKQMLDRYGGDIAKALAAYNAGPARVDAAGGIPQIAETQEYVRKILGKITPPRPIVE